MTAQEIFASPRTVDSLDRWYISPAAIQNYLAVVGFGRSRMINHFQHSNETGKRMLYYTVLGRRTEPRT